MKIHIVTPESGSVHSGNRTTAHRWERLLAELGHDVTVTERWSDQDADVLVALHARKSFASIDRFRTARPAAPIIVAMTGTDIYRDIGSHPEVEAALGHADRLIVLQPLAIERLPAEAQSKARVVYQSATPPPPPTHRSADGLHVCVLAHLRPIKDPLLAASAARLLPAGSGVLVTHAGAPLDEDLARRARKESETNPRYEWVGELGFQESRQLLADSDLLVVSSLDEGGANVISEAVVAGVPPLSTDIPGSVGLLGDSYPGLYPVGDAAGLAEMIARVENDPPYRAELRTRIGMLRHRFDPDVEREEWRSLLAELSP